MRRFKSPKITPPNEVTLTREMLKKLPDECPKCGFKSIVSIKDMGLNYIVAYFCGGCSTAFNVVAR